MCSADPRLRLSTPPIRKQTGGAEQIGQLRHVLRILRRPELDVGQQRAAVAAAFADANAAADAAASSALVRDTAAAQSEAVVLRVL